MMDILDSISKYLTGQTPKKETKTMTKSIGMIIGYKGMDENMQCRGFQYEVGKTYTTDNVEMCESGFHFSNSLMGAANYYPIDGKNRFFKVVGNVIDSDSEIPYDRLYIGHERKKYVADKITIIKEVPIDELIKLLQKDYPLIETEEEYKKGNYRLTSFNKYAQRMTDEAGISEALAMIIGEKEVMKRNHYGALNEIIKYAKALSDENISKDMLIYLLLQALG